MLSTKLDEFRKIDSSVETSVDKSYVRPISTYAASVWCRPVNIALHQMERLRRFERGCLSRTANVRRERGWVKHINSSKIYEMAGCIRIDNYMRQRHINFYQNLRWAGNKFAQLTAQPTPGRYHRLNQIAELNDEGGLQRDGQLLLFHEKEGLSSGTIEARLQTTTTRLLFWFCQQF